MRALKTLLIIILALVGLIVVLGLIGPGKSVVERSTVIAASPDVIYPMISNLKASQDWTPWKDMDKDQLVTYEGTDGTVGSKMTWQGDTVGKGSQEITALRTNEHVGSELKFIEPWEAVSQVDLDMAEVDGGTEVKWTMTQENGFMGRVMGVFMDMDKMVGPDFERGLANLKTLAEEKAAASGPAEYRGFTINTVERPEMVYIGMRKLIGWDQMKGHFESTFPAAFGAAAAAGMEFTGSPSGLYFSWDEENKQTDLMAAVPVKGDANSTLPGMETHVVPGGKALHIAYMGAYEGSGEAHMAMDDMMKERGIEFGSVAIEEYVTDPTTEPDTSKWLTNIYYMVQ
ncbi:MAG: SRPBCC family protein [Flavobacteriales bacterium]|nr:SRPBCC family protein [Flavobacteriales bacterium]